jgi:hypothetical protein
MRRYSQFRPAPAPAWLEDLHRLCRERKVLINEVILHVHRIKGVTIFRQSELYTRCLVTAATPESEGEAR